MSLINNINDTVRPSLMSGLKYSYDVVAKGYNYYTHTVEDLTKESLSPTVAKVVNEFAKALPFTILTLAAIYTVPAYVLVPCALAGYLAAYPLNQRQKITWCNSLGMTDAVVSIYIATRVAATAHPVLYGTSAALFAIFAGLNFYDAYTLSKKEGK